MKRAILIALLAALALTSGLTLTAQDRSRGAARLYELRMYDVRDLVIAVPDYPPCVSMELVPSGGFGFGFAEEEEAELLAYYDGDLLVEMILENVAPASWEELRSVSIDYTNGILSVRHTPAVHERIVELLDALRDRVASQIRITARWLRLPDRVLREAPGNGTGFVLDAETEKVLEEAIASGRAKVVASGSILCSNTQRVAITDVTQVSYLQDYDVEIAQEADIPDPIVSITHEGVVADVRPTIAGRGELVVLEVRADAATLSRPIGKTKTDVGEIEVPATDLTKIRTSVAIPAGRTAVIGGAHSEPDGNGLLLLIRAELVSGKAR